MRSGGCFFALGKCITQSGKGANEHSKSLEKSASGADILKKEFSGGVRDGESGDWY